MNRREALKLAVGLIPGAGLIGQNPRMQDRDWFRFWNLKPVSPAPFIESSETVVRFIFYGDPLNAKKESLKIAQECFQTMCSEKSENQKEFDF